MKDKPQPPETPFAKGYSAFVSGAGTANIPYKPGSQEWRQWFKGFEAAIEASQLENLQKLTQNEKPPHIGGIPVYVLQMLAIVTIALIVGNLGYVAIKYFFNL